MLSCQHMKELAVKNFLRWIGLARWKKYFLAHKIIGSVAIIIVILAGYYGYRWVFNTDGAPRYVLATVERGTIVASVSGTGQVSASSQISLQARASGNIVYITKVTGETVPAGTLIAQIDTRDALLTLENARIVYEKLIKPADKVSVIQAENSLTDARDAEVKAYNDGFNDVASAFVDFPTILTGLDDLLNSYQNGKGLLNDSSIRSYGDTARVYRDTAASSYYLAKNQYDANLIVYKSLTRDSATSSITALIDQTYKTARSLAKAVKDAKSAVDYLKNSQSDNSSTLITSQADLAGWGDKINSDLQTLLLVKNSVDSSARQIRDRAESLAKLKAGADALDVRAGELALRQKQYAYQDYFIRAPFAGVVAKLDVEKNEMVSVGPIGTFITKQKVADISLNEVDVTRVRIGQPVTLTFDAITGLTLTGKVLEADLVGTVSQGVVTYNVKVGFDADDERVRSGMSVNAAIITDTKQNVLTVPNGAVKTKGVDNYVEILDGGAVTPRRKTVVVGISNDTDTEIISGLEAGETVVTRTIAGTAQTANQGAPSIFGATGASRSTGGGALRGR